MADTPIPNTLIPDYADPGIGPERLGKFYIAHRDDYSDPWRAGYKDNVYETREDALEELPLVADYFETDPNFWTVEVYR